jgi:filamentous hemagglutinin family protein
MNRHASMNRIYRLVWSQVRAAWVPVAENAKGRGKSGRARAGLKANAWVAVLPLAFASAAHAGPGGGKVVTGVGSITQVGNTTDINQSSQNLAINWQSFNVAPQETVNFLQPSASAIAVNRIFSSNGSQILGHLSANGQVYLINPNGIVFGKGAEINVGGLVASTLDLNDASFIGSAKSFSGSAIGSITNEGTITAATGGYVALLGNRVSNQGLITARLGTVALAAGSGVTLTFNGNSLVHLQVDRSVLNSLADNGGVLRADGGQVVMTAGAKDALLASVVNNTGVIEARTVENHDGTITLLGGMSAGSVNVAGTLDASASEGGNGGRIETSGAHVEIAGGTKVTTASSTGLYGSWLIDPQDFTVAASGGDVTGATLSSELGSTAVTLQSSNGHGTGSGNVNVNDAVAWSANTALTLTASNNVNVNANITATGAAAGLVINPNTANGSEKASGTGAFNLGTGASINLPNVSPTSKTALVMSGTPYTVINSLGAAGSITGTDLQGMNGNLSGHYALGGNIDATPTSAWNAGSGFTPIGNSSTAFTGVLDGLGHSVGHLTINQPKLNDVGLLGSVGLASIVRNIGLSGGSVSGGNYVGALVGMNSGATIVNTYSTAPVKGASDVGGLVGYTFQGTIDTSYATGNVSGTNYVGGLLGYNAAATVSNSHATGSVSGSSYVGGLLGFNYGNYEGKAVVSRSYATGNVTGSTNVGGLLGGNGGDYGGSVSNSYATGIVSGGGNVGGLVGYNGGGNFSSFGYGTVGTIGNSYATGHIKGTGQNVGGLVGLNSATISNSYATGSVDGTDYAGGLVGYNGGANGNFKSDGTIGTVIGSFASGSVMGATNVGGLVGFNGGGNGNYGTVGTVKTSYATGSVSGNNLVGGLVGSSSGVSMLISDSYATGKVTGTSNAGGLVGSNAGTVSNSFWDMTTSGLTTSAGGIGMTTAQMQTQANFTSATAANGNVNPNWDFANTWVLYEGHTYPLLSSFMTPLTVTANGGSVTYTGSAYNGAKGVTYSTAPNGNLFGTLSYGSSPHPAVNVGSYVITPGGLYSNQQGYIIHYVSGTLTIDQLASVAWIGGSSGNWSNPANWAGGAIPDYANVGAVTIPAGVTVTYDGGVPGSTALNTLTSSGNLVMAAGKLSTSGNLSTQGFQQSGGMVGVGGTFDITSSSSAGVTLGNIVAGSLNISSRAGAITQLASAALEVSGPSSLTADNGISGTGDVKYGISLWHSVDNFVGPVSLNGSDEYLTDGVGGVILGNIVANGTLTVLSRNGAITQAVGAPIRVNQASSFTADNGISGTGDVKYGISLWHSVNNFVGPVSLNGSDEYLTDGAGGVILGNIVANGTLGVLSRGGAITQAAGTAVDASNTSAFSADNRLSGNLDVKYGIALANPANHFGGPVHVTGSAITVDSAGALTANVNSTGATSLESAGSLAVSGTIGTDLTTVTTGGTGSTTTFGTATVGNDLNVTSPAAVTTVTPSTALQVHGAGTHTPNSHVTVNHVSGALIE